MKSIKSLLFAFVLLPFGYLYATECKVDIDRAPKGNNSYVVVLTYSEGCEVVMDTQSSRIVLVPKVKDTGVTEANSTAVESTPIEKLITLARSKLGSSYQNAAAGPDHFDCSGFVYYLFKENGIAIPRTSLAQSKSGAKLTRAEIQRGDILFFDTYERGHVNHSGVYLGDGKFIHASSGKAYGVTISELDKGYYVDKFRWGIRKMKER